MAYYTFPQIRKRLLRLGIPSQASSYLSKLVLKYISKRGLEGAVIRLKQLGESLLNYLVAKPAKVPWVKTVNGFPKALLPIKGLTEEVLFRMTRLHRLIVLDNPTESQLSKTFSGATEPYSGTETGVSQISLLIKKGVSVSIPTRVYSLDSKPQLVTRVFSKVMSRSGTVNSSSKPPILDSFKILGDFLEIASLEYAADMFYPLDEDSYFRVLHAVKPSGEQIVGEIHASQEPGAKLRMFAAPYTVIQCALSPIHDWIVDNFSRFIPEICTWNQLKGAERAQKRLTDGCTVWSFDLTTATCRFPLDPQLEMLEVLGLPTHLLTVLRLVCRGKWKVVSGMGHYNNAAIISWAVGQPLGIRPSMSMFTLGHAMLLKGICHLVGAPLDCFDILGDDVLIYNELVASMYESVMVSAGVPINYTKSHISKRYAEFAGASITPELIVRAGQFRELSKENVLSLCEEFGLLPDRLFVLEQKLHLFMRGNYEPNTVKEYQMLLKASSKFNEELMMKLFIDIPKAPWWGPRIVKEFHKQISEEIPDVFSIRLHFRGNSRPKLSSLARYYHEEYFMSDEDKKYVSEHPRMFTNSYSFDNLFMLSTWFLISFTNGILSGKISVNEALALAAQVRQEIISWFYLPPANISKVRLDLYTWLLAQS